MKNLVILFVILPLELLLAQNSMVLNFNENNLASNTNTFKCVGQYTYFNINTFPVDTSYYVTLKKDSIIFEQGYYSSINIQSPGFLTLDSLIYAGFYELTVISLTNNITFTDTFSFKNPDSLYFDYSIKHPQSCLSFGKIFVQNISGGTSPYSLGKINATGEFEPDYFQNSNFTSYIIDSLNVGYYSVSLQDSFGCVYTLGSDSPIEIIQGPEALNIISSHQEDSFRICVQGGLTPYTFILNDDTTIYNDTCVSYALCSGVYDFKVYDSVEDTICMDTLNFTIEEIDGYIQQTTSTMIVESGGIPPFSYSWTKNSELQADQTESIFLGGLCPGIYTCTVIDRAYCSSFFELNIDELESNLTEEIDCFDTDFSSLETSVSGGTSPYEYLWNNNETSSVLTNLNPQLYTVTITDNNGCKLIDEVEVPVLKDSCLFNAFSPNGDFINDTWEVNPSFIYENSKVIIYNRWGVKVYESEGYEKPWDGKNLSGELVKEGVYFYSIILKNGHDKIKGSLSVFY